MKRPEGIKPNFKPIEEVIEIKQEIKSDYNVKFIDLTRRRNQTIEQWSEEKARKLKL